MEKNTKLVIGIVAGVIIFAGAAFYGGTAYAQGKFPTIDFSQIMKGSRTARSSRRGSTGGASTSAIGKIISRNDTSITVQLSNGSSRTIFFSPETTVTKAAPSATDKLMTNESVIVSGVANEDGSLTAKSIQTGFVTLGAKQPQGQ